MSNQTQMDKNEYGNFPCIKCGKKGLRFKENPCSRCKRNSSVTKQTQNKEDGVGMEEMLSIAESYDKGYQDGQQQAIAGYNDENYKRGKAEAVKDAIKIIDLEIEKIIKLRRDILKSPMSLKPSEDNLHKHRVFEVTGLKRMKERIAKLQEGGKT